jgi:alpha-mannosidase
VCIFYVENAAEKFNTHYTWRVAEKGFKMAFMMNKLAKNNSCEIILEK